MPIKIPQTGSHNCIELTKRIGIGYGRKTNKNNQLCFGGDVCRWPWGKHFVSKLLFCFRSVVKGLIHLAGVFTWLKAIIYSILLPLLLIVGGVAFLFRKRLGRLLIKVGYICELLFRLEGLILFWVFCFQTKRSILSESVSQASMIPSYLIVGIELLVLFYLTRKDKSSKSSLK